MVTLEGLGPFECVLDVGGNVGEFAEQARRLWPAAQITSFEPLPGAAKANRKRATGRWWVEECAVSDHTGEATLHYCVNQHSASTLQVPGAARRERFGILDTFHDFTVRTRRLDDLAVTPLPTRTLVKVDVEGHELQVLDGAAGLLDQVACVVCEVNQDPDVFVGAAPPSLIDDTLRSHRLFFRGVLGVQLDPAGQVVQFDGVWSR